MKFYRLIEFLRRFVDAVRHVRSGGRTTRARAVRRAAAPPRRCACCGGPVNHSADWRDHLDTR
ncbi:MAG: hypothetical protein AB7L91_17970 [Dehalococcoidia bacterium]